MAQAVFAVLFALGVLCLWVVLIYWTTQTIRTGLREKRAPVETLKATVTRCHEIDEYLFNMGQTMTAHHLVEFESDDGRAFSFSLTPAQYRSFDEGDSGLLKVRNNSFVSFQSLTPTGQTLFKGRNDSDRVYRRIVKGK